LIRDDVKQLIRSTVHETLIVLGIDPSSPIEFQADMRTLREWRLSSKILRRGMIGGVILTILSGALAALWIGLKALILK
jgi:hypothetical protein